jgi:hypothetical protein
MVISHKSTQGLVLGRGGEDRTQRPTIRTWPGACQPVIKQPIARWQRHLPLLHCQTILNKRFNYTLAPGSPRFSHDISKLPTTD